MTLCNAEIIIITWQINHCNNDSGNGPASQGHCRKKTTACSLRPPFVLTLADSSVLSHVPIALMQHTSYTNFSDISWYISRRPSVVAIILYSTSSISTSTVIMKTYELGTTGDSNLAVKKIGGEFVVIIKVKDAELKFVELPPKRWVFYIEFIVIYLFTFFYCILWLCLCMRVRPCVYICLCMDFAWFK